MKKAPFTVRPVTSYIEPSTGDILFNRVQTGLGHLLLGTAFLSFLYCISPLARAESLKFASILPERNIKLTFKEEPAPSEDYKTQRLREMADMWKGTSLEPHTVMLLSMLLVEDGTLTAERRHDCEGSRGCYAIGIQGHHICHRGTPIVSQRAGKPWKKFCYAGAIKDFEKEYPSFSFEWRTQFSEYTVRMTDCIDSGKSVNQCIQLWNSREVGRIAKVKTHNAFIRSTLDL